MDFGVSQAGAALLAPASRAVEAGRGNDDRQASGTLLASASTQRHKGAERAVSSVGRASRLHREGRRFESVTAHHDMQSPPEVGISVRSPWKTVRWRISRIKAAPACEIGTETAPDAESAIRRAIEQYEITDPHKQSRLAARRVAPGRNLAGRNPMRSVASRLTIACSACMVQGSRVLLAGCVTIGAMALSSRQAMAWFGCVAPAIPYNCHPLETVGLVPARAYFVRYPTCSFWGFQSTSLLVCMPSNRLVLDRRQY